MSYATKFTTYPQALLLIWILFYGVQELVDILKTLHSGGEEIEEINVT